MASTEEFHLEDVIRAQGLAISLIAALLENQRYLQEGEVSKLLAILAVKTAENNENVGDVLAIWAAMARDATSESK